MEPLLCDGIHHLPFDPTCPISVRYLLLRPPACTLPRRHSYIELLFIQHGSVVMSTGGSTVQLQRGDVCLIPEQAEHRIQDYLSRSLRVAALYFLPRVIFADGAAVEESHSLQPLCRAVQGPVVLRPERETQGEVLQALRHIHELQPAMTPSARLAAKTYLKLILVQLLACADPGWNSAPDPHSAAEEMRRLQPLFDYLDRHYARGLTVEQAAAMLDMSKSHFMRKFHAVTGTGLITYLNRLRIARAKQLIATTEGSLAGIGQEVGFCDQSYFGAVFRKLAGVTPSEFRRKARQG